MKRERALANSFLNSLVTTFSGKCFLISLLLIPRGRSIMLSVCYSTCSDMAQLLSSDSFIYQMDRQNYILRQALKSRIREFITQIPSPKLILAHPDLLSLFNFAYEFKFNQLLGDKDRLFEFEENDQATDESNADNLVFLLHPISSAMRTIKSMVVRNDAKFMTHKRYTICFTPKTDIICLQELERLNMKSKIQITNFDFGLIPFPHRLISLQLSPHCSEVDIINSCMTGLLLFAKLVGLTKRIVGKGEKSQMILQMMENVIARDELFTTHTEQLDSLLVVMDRGIDPVTPFLTPHSYEGLIDHFYGIDLTRIRIPQKLLGKESQNLQTYRLYNRDKIYDEIAHMDIIENLSHLENARTKIRAEVSFRKQIARDAKEYEEVTSVWGVKYEQANNHLSIINSILNAMNQQMHFRNLINIEMDILQQKKVDFDDLHLLTLNYPPEHILRLICLQSQTYPLPNYYQRHQKDLLELMGNYSNQHIMSLHHLQHLSWLRNSKIKNKWEEIVKTYSLIPQQESLYSKVYIKYAPLSVRFLEMLIKGQLSAEANALLGRDNNHLRGIDNQNRPIKNLYVFYVGGITFGEISCLRLLEKELGITITVLTTHVRSGYEMIKKTLSAVQL